MVKVKNLSNHSLYINQYLFNETSDKSILFIHGGPGSNCSAVEYFIEMHGYFNTLKYNLIVYDQRGCGRSISTDKIIHHTNVDDLSNIITYLMDNGITVIGAIGHSYGAKILIDYLLQSKNSIDAIFVGACNEFLTPRINNLLLDLNYLKITNRKKYEAIFDNFIINDLNDLWLQTIKLAQTFQDNTERPYYYWANLTIYELYKHGASYKKLHLAHEVFETVRESLYSHEIPILDFKLLTNKFININGFHDYIMNGYHRIFDNSNSNLFIFDKSGHYPHFEENHKFCEKINLFIN